MVVVPAANATSVVGGGSAITNPVVTTPANPLNLTWLMPYIPFIWIAVIIVIIAIVMQRARKKTKPDPMEAMMAGKKLVCDMTAFDMKEKIKTLGIRYNLFMPGPKRRLLHGYNFLGYVIRAYQNLVQVTTVKEGNENKPIHVPATFFLVAKRGFMPKVKGCFGRGLECFVLKSDVVTDAGDGGFVIQDFVDIERHNGIWMQFTERGVPSETKGITENISWKLAHEEGLGRYLDYPRKLTNLNPAHAMDTEKINEQARLETEKQKSRIKSMM